MIQHLCAGRPVAVGMNIRGLKGFRPPNNDSKLVNTIKQSGHAFAIVGFERRKVGGKEKYVFKTRNSWGGINPDIDEDELWRLNALVALHTTKTKAPAGLAALAGTSSGFAAAK